MMRVDMISIIFRYILFIGFIALCGCSMFQPDKQTLNITCNPTDMIVKVNGDRFDCPVRVDVRRDSKVLLEASKEGYEPYAKSIDYHFSTSAKWDAVGTVCWGFPVIGLLFPGAWNLDQTEFKIELFPIVKK
jgi:hypothetical protein